jgi:hypothetical protein
VRSLPEPLSQGILAEDWLKLAQEADKPAKRRSCLQVTKQSETIHSPGGNPDGSIGD